MKTQLTHISPIKKKMVVELPLERVVEALEKAYQKIAKEADLQGFRKGHIPRPVVEKYFSKDAEKEAMEHLVATSCDGAIAGEKLKRVSLPEIDLGPFQKDAPFSYTMEFEVWPEIGTISYQDLPLTRKACKVTEKEVEDALKKIQMSRMMLEPAPEGTMLEKGMVAFIDYNGTADGKSFSGCKQDNFLVEIGSGTTLAAFEDGLIGMAGGESRRFSFKYPDDYFKKELAGKKAEFDVKLREIKLKQLPALDDELAKELGQYKTLNEFKEDIKKKILHHKEWEAQQALGQGALDELVKRHQFEVSRAMVEDEMKVMYNSLLTRLAREGKKPEDVGLTPELFIKESEKLAADRVRGNLLLDAIAEAEGIKVEESDVDNYFSSWGAQAGKSPTALREDYEKRGIIDGLKIVILHEKTLDFVVLKAKIKVERPK